MPDKPDYPTTITETNHIAPVPRWVRATVGGQLVLNTTHALYVWEWPNYPQFYIPLADVTPGLLLDEDYSRRSQRGTARRHALQIGDQVKPAAAWVYGADALAGLRDHVRFEWDALDSWFEEDEEIFAHPRNPYVRVDALHSTRHVRVALEGVTLAESHSPVLVFETGKPTRYYLNRTEVDFIHLVPTDTVSACPYKGRTSGYWSVRIGGTLYQDLAWAYAYPTAALASITGLIAFYNEKVDIFVDGKEIPRPPINVVKK
jgi:uncharacterized protein (DUF427 family)